jgi:hypothetical protein
MFPLLGIAWAPVLVLLHELMFGIGALLQRYEARR